MHPLTPPAPSAALRAAVGQAAAREWQRLAELHPTARLILVADLVWNHAYPLAHRASHAAVTGQISVAASVVAAQLRDLGEPDPRASASLRRLAAAAEHTARRTDVMTPPAHRDAIGHAARLPGAPPPWRVATALGWADALRHGAVGGALTAATDTLIAWRTSGRPAGWVNGQPVQQWAHELLTQIYRQVNPPGMSRGGPAGPRRGETQRQGRGGEPGPGPPPSAATAAQLAAQDRAAGVGAATVVALDDRRGRVRASASASALRRTK